MPGGVLPSGTVTFLFTDVEGSTRLWSERGAEMRDSMALHDRLLREAIEGQSGYVFTTAGDSFAAAFGRAADALAAAVELRRSVQEAEWPAGVVVRVRVGLHTGEADERDGDYFGSAVNRAARLMSAAHGGQVVVSGATRDVLVDVPLGEVGLVAIGEHSLKDFDEPVKVFEVVESSLSTPFLSLRTEWPAPGNLPQRLEPLVGRGNDVAAVLRLLDGRNLVTVVGVGGIGKTRLSLACAAERRLDYEHGVWWCELAPVGDPEGVVQTIAQTIGALQHPERSMVDSVAEYCRRRRMLLVLDNCEHVLDAAGDVIEALLAIAPEVDVIATSREALGVEGEQIYPLASLPSDGAEAPAVKLFVQRASAVIPDLDWDADRVRSAERICERLDGMPLAIELAATRIRSLSLAEIEQQLDQAFRVLRGGRRSVERHRTLEAAIDWSYEALAEADRVLFDRLSVFAGGFDLAAATAVCADDELVHADEIIDLLDDLVAKSLIVADRVDGSIRYRMLEPLRQYAEDRLAISGDAERVRRTHLDHFVAWAEEWRTEVPISGLGWRHRLERNFSNLRAAIHWAFQLPDTEAAARIIGALPLAQQALMVFEIGDWADRALDLPDIGQVPLGPGIAGGAAMNCWWRADVEGFLQRAQQAEAMPAASLQPTPSEAALGLATVRGLSAALAGDLEAAASAWDLDDRSDVLVDAVVAWLRLSFAADHPDEEWARTVNAFELTKLERLAQSTGSSLIESMYQHQLGRIALGSGAYSEARSAAHRGIDAAFDVGSAFYAHHSVVVLAQTIAWLSDDCIEDLAVVATALRDQRDAGHIADQWLILSGAAAALHRCGVEQLPVDTYQGLLRSQWRSSSNTRRLADVLGTSASDELGAPPPSLGDLVDQTLAAINEVLGPGHS